MKYRTGQKWSYKNRPEDRESRVVILRLENVPPWGTIVFVAIEGLRVRDKSSTTGYRARIAFCPFSEAALDNSVIAVVAECDVPDDREVYERWRRLFDRGLTGCYGQTVAETVTALQQICDT